MRLLFVFALACATHNNCAGARDKVYHLQMNDGSHREMCALGYTPDGSSCYEFHSIKEGDYYARICGVKDITYGPQDQGGAVPLEKR